MSDEHEPDRSISDLAGESREARGRRTLADYHGAPGEEVIARLRDISPDFADQLVAYAFGDVYSRPGLDKRSRQIATVAALAALGDAEPQLKWHIRGALKVGITRGEVLEILMQMAIYGGFPAAVRAMTAAKEVFDEIDEFSKELARQDDA